MLALLAVPLLATVFPCKPDTREHEAAEKALHRLSVKIEALDPAGDPKPLWKELDALRDQRCFEGSGEEYIAAPASALSLKEWWSVSGHYWVRSYLDLEDAPKRTVVAGDPRKALTVESPGDAALATLLCKAGDETCGSETRGWQKRAARAFRLHAFENGRAKRPEHGPSSTPGNARPECDAEAKAKPGEKPEQTYSRWRACARGTLEKSAALPLGNVRAPTDGWLVVRGRRGHYSFCDEVRIYDLATGAAWIAQSCSGLALRNDGSVDGATTDDGRRAKTRAGRVSVDALREAAWMTLVSSEVEKDVVLHAEYIDVPAGLAPAWPDPGTGELGSIGLGMSFWMSSAQTQLSVTWKRAGKDPVERTLTYPESSDAAEDHAVFLLGIAEDSFVEGCPPAAFPVTVASRTKAPVVGSLDAPGGVAPTQDELVERLLDLPSCK